MDFYLPVAENLVLVIMTDCQIARFNQRSFRGPDVVRAGNFRLWKNMAELLADPFMARTLASLIYSLIVNFPKYETTKFTITYPEFVGWQGTVNNLQHPWIFKLLKADDLETFWLNARYSAQRIRPGHPLLAPLGRDITFTVKIARRKRFREDAQWVIYMNDVYLSWDLGALRQNGYEVLYLPSDQPGETYPGQGLDRLTKTVGIDPKTGHSRCPWTAEEIDRLGPFKVMSLKNGRIMPVTHFLGQKAAVN